MKKWKKESRKFLNAHYKDCTAAISWTVKFVPGKYDSHRAYERKDRVEAEFRATEDCMSHWVSRKSDLRPIDNMIKELKAFRATALKALEDANAKEKS